MFDCLDRFRERQAWLPAWLDDAHWKTWLWHGAFTALGGMVGGPLLATVIAAGYGIREFGNVQELRKEQKELVPVDHVMDVLIPMLVAYVWWRL